MIAATKQMFLRLSQAIYLILLSMQLWVSKIGSQMEITAFICEMKTCLVGRRSVKIFAILVEGDWFVEERLSKFLRGTEGLDKTLQDNRCEYNDSGLNQKITHVVETAPSNPCLACFMCSEVIVLCIRRCFDCGFSFAVVKCRNDFLSL